VLYLLDLLMPEMDGLEVCERLKADPLTQQIPIIFLTASNEMEHLVKGFAAGAVDYVTKPFNAPELLARVRTHLELKHARERLREMNDEKNEFMGIVAHDLRSPLGTITGFADLILDDPQLAREELEDFVRRIRDTAARMSEMVQKLLDANAIERGEVQLKLAPVELSSALISVIEAYRPRAAAKRQTIELQDEPAPITVVADRNLIVQVLEKLCRSRMTLSPSFRAAFTMKSTLV
jgi:two-component system, sensor histidine kinase and response regulator